MSNLLTLDDFVAAFEAALARGARTDLADFLPEAGHSQRLQILVELIRVELEHEWENGTPCPLESYFQRFPEAFADLSLRRVVAFEEYRLRRQAGQDPDPDVYAQTYSIDTRDWPGRREDNADALLSVARSYRDFRQRAGNAPQDAGVWQEHVEGSPARLFRELHQSDPRAAARLADGLTGMPTVGETFLGFQLVAELGRGAFGRVYLAHQESLANRLVALKIAPDVGGESQTLAQLQHTHIVPLYSMHRSGPLQAVCMPYFGSVTLADILRDLHRRAALPRSGSDLLEQLSSLSSPFAPVLGEVGVRRGRLAVSRSFPLTPNPESPKRGRGEQEEDPESPKRGRGEQEKNPHSTVPIATLKRLEGLSYVEAVVWLGCCLADGLAHAHERGILHRDLKPANVLLTDEGQPMLLDFNLAEDTKLRDSASAAVVGGTIPYMAPEQLSAFRGGSEPIDARSDIFALGIILYELLAGQSPFPPPALNAPAGSSDAEIDVFVACVLHSRTSSPIPIQQRNRSVTPAVWSILRRCLEPAPALRYPLARQVQEDLQRQLDSETLRHAPDPSLRERLRKRFRRSPKLLGRLITTVALVVLLVVAGLGYRAYQGKKAEEAHAEELRQTRHAYEVFTASRKEALHVLFALSIDEDPAHRAEGVRQARMLLDRYHLDNDDWRSGPLAASLLESDRRQLEQELGELILVLARFVPESEALTLLDRAEDLFGEDVPPALWLQRAGAVETLGRREEGRQLRDRALRHPPRSARDFTFQARPLMTARKFREALPLLEKAVAIDPRSLPAHLLLGICHDQLDHHEAAVGCYNVCLARAVDFHGGYFNRALALSRLKKYVPALADYERAIALRPESPDGYLNRGLLRLEMGRTKNDLALVREAVADFSRVLELDDTQTRVLFFRSQAKTLLKDTAGAEADLQAGLRRDPGDARSWNARGYAHLARNEVQEALRCFDEGVTVNPRSLPNLTSKAYLLSDYLSKPEEALAICDRMVKLFPDYLYGHVNRGVMLARLGRRKEALEDARQALARSDEPEMLYRVACIYALTARQTPADADQAFPLLHRALKGGFGIVELPGDADLKPLHALPEFARLRDLAQNLATSPRPAVRP